jgi:CheY-like chemotaxis protein
MLGGILGSLSIMELDSKGDPGRKREVEEMKALVKRGAGMTRQLLGFAHRGHYEAKPLDLIDVVDKTLELYHRTRKDVVLQTEFPDDDVNIMGDPSQVEQVMMNLFVNAGQAMPRGGVLSVRLEKVEPTLEVREPLGILPGPFAQVTVRDTGVGMDKPTLDRIFEPFFTTKGAGTGTGLGLASVYGIVKNHGGFVQVESRPGKGTTFAVYLPVTDRIPVAEETPGSCPVWFRDEDKRTILLVDDEEPILRTCTKTLQAIGFEVHSARNGREALEIFKARKDQVSVVILDMVMPGMSGWDTFEALKMLDPKVKVLLASGYIREGHAALEMETGTHGFIEKPFDLETLSVKLKELI